MGNEHGHGSAAHFAEIAVAFAGESSVRRLCELVIVFARQLTACDSASVVLLQDRGKLESVAATSADIGAIDEAQLRQGEGPCIASIGGEHRISVADSTRDTRWPLWGKAVTRIGFVSVLCLRLSSGEAALGALTLYSARVDGFGSAAGAQAAILAAHASLALAALQAQDGLRISVSTRTLIGQAEGILMERYGIDDDKAFAVLRRYSQDSNVKLLDVAANIVATRRLPESR